MNTKKTGKRKLIFVCSPLRDNLEKNRRIAECICRLVTLLGHIPIAPHVYFTRFLDDNNELERRAGIEAGIELLKHCDEVWVFQMPNMTDGMLEETRCANELGIPIMYFILNERPTEFYDGV